MLLDKDDAMNLLGCSESTLYRRIQQGQIKAVKIGGSTRYQLVGDLEEGPPPLENDTPITKTWRTMNGHERLLRVEGLMTECMAILMALKAAPLPVAPPEKANGTPVELNPEEEAKMERRRRTKQGQDKVRWQGQAVIEKFNLVATLGKTHPRTFKTSGRALKCALARLRKGATQEELLLVATWANEVAISGIRPEDASRLYGRYSWGFASEGGENQVSPYVLWNDKFEERLHEAKRWEEAQRNVEPETTYEEGWA